VQRFEEVSCELDHKLCSMPTQNFSSTRQLEVSDGPFLTYWQCGYEGADHINHGGRPLDMNSANAHQQRAYDDYLRLHEFGIRTVRESIGWRLVEKEGGFDFSVIEARVRAAQRLGIQICWTLLHYGWPEDLDVYGDQFVPRFARYCRAVAEFLKPFGGPAPVFSPVNEISFTSWGLSVRMFCCLNMDYEHAGRDAKRQLVRAAIAGCDAIWDVIPGARMLHCDPLIHVIAHDNEQASFSHAETMHESQFEAFDMLAGRLHPELGGAPRYLDLMGVNYYDTNQWEAATGQRLWWHLDDARRRPLHEMLSEVYARYSRPLLLAETGHVGSGRGVWIREVAEQAVMARQHGVDISGICLYPGIDRPDWENPDYWHHSGIWDVVSKPDDPQARVLAPAYAAGLRQAQSLTEHFNRRLENILYAGGDSNVPTIVVFSHIRWDSAYNRPRHLLSQLARHYKIMYVEEPVSGATTPYLEMNHPAPGVTVFRQHMSATSSSVEVDPWASLQPWVVELVKRCKDLIAWFYAPMALPLLDAVDPRLVIYDCMNEAVSSSDTFPLLSQRERSLSKVADLVFTSSQNRYDNWHSGSQDVYCFPDSVDAIHFAQALDRSNGHPSHAAIVGPRLGFYGVINERIDMVLIASMADTHPEWQIVLVGPVVNITADQLLQRSNIHYLGALSYKVLPQLLADWDVCLMPYLASDASPSITSTSLLEYMAAERPIVSTPLEDVRALHGDIIAVAHDTNQFITACELALTLPHADLANMAERMRAIVTRTSWVATTDAMHEIICARTAVAMKTASSV
jgi:UDP-galactopyranose mutase